MARKRHPSSMCVYKYLIAFLRPTFQVVCNYYLAPLNNYYHYKSIIIHYRFTVNIANRYYGMFVFWDTKKYPFTSSQLLLCKKIISSPYSYSTCWIAEKCVESYQIINSRSNSFDVIHINDKKFINGNPI